MKTVKPPKSPDLYHIACKNPECEAVIECMKSELRYFANQKEGDSYIMSCPHCNKDTWVDVNEIEKYSVNVLGV